MIELFDQDISGNHDEEGPVNISGFKITKSYFSGNHFGIIGDSYKRSIFSDIQLFDCHHRGNIFGAVIFRNILLHKLRCSNGLNIWGSAYDRVKITGKIDNLCLDPYLQGDINEDHAAFIHTENQKVHNDADWCLDISEAIFKDCYIKGIPVEKVILDSESQFILSGDKIPSLEFIRSTSWNDYVTPDILEQIFHDKSEYILIAPKGHKKNLERIMRDIEILSTEGICN